MELVVNPSAGGGRAGKRLVALERALRDAGLRVNVHSTRGRRDLHDTVKRVVLDKAPLVGVLGGDGTFHDAVNALLSDEGQLIDCAETVFVSLPAGTGGDLGARTLQLPSDPAALARVVATGRDRAFDLGKITYVAEGGRRAVKLFANIASCGISGRVDDLVARGPKWLGGKAAYFVASLRANLGWKNQQVRIVVDDALLYEGPVMTAAVCNGRAFGGGMLVAPDARADDGVFDITVLGDIGLAGVATLSSKLYAGTHRAMPEVTVGRGRRVVIETPERDLRLDVDGETPGFGPATIEMLPGAIKLRHP